MGVDPVEVRERVAALRAGLPAPDVCAHVRNVVIVASSSRGGSSILAEVLRRVPGLVHLRAEMNPQLRLFGCAGEESDAVSPNHPIPPGLSQALGADCGRPTDALPDSAVPAFAAEIAARLVVQWPTFHVEHAPVLADVRATLASLRAAGWPADRFVDAPSFYASCSAASAPAGPPFTPRPTISIACGWRASVQPAPSCRCVRWRSRPSCCRSLGFMPLNPSSHVSRW